MSEKVLDGIHLRRCPICAQNPVVEEISAFPGGKSGWCVECANKSHADVELRVCGITPAEAAWSWNSEVRRRHFIGI